MPILFPDMSWVWESFCFLNERRQVGPSGPQPISVEAMTAYVELTERTETRYREKIIRFIPEMDRVFLNDFYTKQQEAVDEQQKKAKQAARKSQMTGRSR